MPRHNRLKVAAFDVAERISRLRTIAGLMEEFAQFAGQFGLDAVLLTGLPNHQFENAILASRWPTEFLDIYTKKDYIKHDPIARRGRIAASPFQWNESSYAKERDNCTLEVMYRAADFGIRQGLIVPIHGLHRCPQVVSLAGVRADLSPDVLPMLDFVSVYAFHQGMRIGKASKERKPQLTDREREVLLWVTEGKTAWEIGKILNISTRTVNEHVKTACRRLNARNRVQAVALAMHEHMLDMTPPRWSERAESYRIADHED